MNEKKICACVGARTRDTQKSKEHYEMITETEYDRLMELWELRAQSVQKAGPYKDRVVEMLELAARAIWDAYGENVAAYDEKVSRMHREARRIAQENLLRDLDSKNI